MIMTMQCVNECDKCENISVIKGKIIASFKGKNNVQCNTN